MASTLKLGLFVALGALSAALVLAWIRSVRARPGEPPRPSPVHLAIGFVTNFFDTLGIGSFATTTTAYKLLRLVPDELIPGTMLAGHCLPVVVQAFIFMTIIELDPVTLVTLIAACLAGGWLGAGIVSGLPRRLIQIGMGTALLLAAAFMMMGQLGLFPAGGAALTLSAPKLALALVVNFVLGALLSLGIGNYAPSLVLFSLLGMDPRAAFPVMMGSGAFSGTAAAIRFLRTQRYHPGAGLGLIAGGIPAVLVAGLLVKSLPLGAVRWLVVVVVVYTSVMMLRSAAVERRVRQRASAPGPVAPPVP
jgi:uncharacterized membrane protein YfcA